MSNMLPMLLPRCRHIVVAADDDATIVVFTICRRHADVYRRRHVTRHSPRYY